MFGRGAAGEAGASKIQCSPKEVDRAHLASKTRAEHAKDPCGLQEDAPESLYILGVVLPVREILIEGNGLRDRPARETGAGGSRG